MVTSTRMIFIAAGVAVVLGVSVGCAGRDNNTKPQEPSEPSTPIEPEKPATAGVNNGVDGNCIANPKWFPHSDTQRSNDAAFKSSSNCVFHQWAWQNFLWLTQDVKGEPRFMSFVSPHSLLPQSDKNGQATSMLQVTGKKNRIVLLPRMAKSSHAESFDEFLQAGTDGIFVDHNGRAVYYSQYLDDTFVKFINDKKLTDPDSLLALIKQNPNTEFPITGTAGAMELKVSWKIVGENDDVSGMFTVDATVASLANRNGAIVIDTTKPLDVKVALVGFHIAGIVEGHPEMIWATFEHKRNAPNVTPGTPLGDPVSIHDYTFYAANTTLANCNINYSSSNGLTLNEANQTLSPVTQACRQYEYGNQPGIAGSDKQKKMEINNQNIKKLNSSVDNSLDSNDVWRNYREVGAIWFNTADALKPGMSLATDTLLTGSLSLSNSTIETFTQVATSENNCFRCHNTKQTFPPKEGLKPLPASNLSISHALKNIYFWSQE